MFSHTLNNFFNYNLSVSLSKLFFDYSIIVCENNRLNYFTSHCIFTEFTFNTHIEICALAHTLCVSNTRHLIMDNRRFSSFSQNAKN